MNADRLAPWYRWIEYAAFGQALERHRFFFLDRLSGARNVLLMGEGDGRTLQRLLEVAPHAHVDVVESSARMIGIAKLRIGPTNRVRFHHQDADTMEWPPGAYEAVVTSFFLDCFDEYNAMRIVKRLARSLNPGGIWLMNDFTIPPKGWRHWYARAYVGAMYRFFRLTTGLLVNQLPPIERLLDNAGLQLSEADCSFSGMIVSQVWRPKTTMAGPA